MTKTSSELSHRESAKGYVFSDWKSIEKIYYPSANVETDRERKLVLKYKRLAALATHTNAWLRDIAAADPEKSLYENNITTGTSIDGMCISLVRIEKYCGSVRMELFRKALKDGKSYSTSRFDFCGLRLVRSGASRVITAT